MFYVCTVCDGDFNISDGLISETVPLFYYGSGIRINGWNFRISLCAVCRVQFGLPVRAFTNRPYQTSFAEFEKSEELIELKGAVPRN